MKKTNRFLKLLLIVAILFMGIPTAKASGSASLSFSGSSSVVVGNNIEITLAVSDINNVNGGIAAVGGRLNFDEEYLEFVSSQSLAPYTISYAKTSKKIAGLAFDEESRITSNSNLIKFTFKALKSGSTTISLGEVSLTDGTSESISGNSPSKTITITDQASKSNNANLSSLSITNHTITPTFNKNITNYSLTVPYSVSSITVNATKEDNKASLTGTGAKALNVGNNTIQVVVTAEDGITKKTYIVNVTRQENTESTVSSDNTLSNLSVSGYTISPSFNKNNTNYSVSIPNEATEVIVKATTNDSKAKVEITGNTNLKVGVNTVSVKVTAEDGSVKTYTIEVTRKEKDTITPTLDDDATLSKLYIGGYTLNPTFNKNVNVYTIYVGEAVGGLDVEAIPTSSKATVKVTGNMGWNYGMNHVSIVVTAENGNKNTYIINVNRKDPNAGNSTNKSNDTTLSKLVIAGAELSPTFNKKISNYTVTVPYDIEKLDITAIANNKNAKVEIMGNEDLKVDTVNTIQIQVTAEDGSIGIYTINATRSGIASNTYLKSLSINGYTLSPKFDKTILVYDVKVNYNTNSLDLTAIAENESAKVEITGNENFKVGNNVVLIKVTDENGFIRIYQINVEKEDQNVMGMSSGFWLMWGLLFIGLLAILFLLFLLFKRKKDRGEAKVSSPVQPVPPVIDFKPEFNFGSRNGTDDDVIYSGRSLNQGSQIGTTGEPKKLIDAEDAKYYIEDYEDEDSMFDDTITKDELIRAIKEGMETKNPDKLRMLLKQDELNQLKKKIRKEEKEKKTRSDHYEGDDYE